MTRSWNPNTASWLAASRKARAWKQDAVVELLAARGVSITRSWLSRIENGEPFSDELLAAFVELYESEPPAYQDPAPEPASSDALATLVAILERQTEELRLMREVHARAMERLDALETLMLRNAPTPQDPAADASVEWAEAQLDASSRRQRSARPAGQG